MQTRNSQKKERELIMTRTAEKIKRLRMSGRSQNLLAQIKSKTGMTPNIAGRFAICISLNDPSPPNPDEFDENGSEIHPSVLFGDHEHIYKFLLSQRLYEDNLDPSLYLNRMLRAHFNRGVISLFARLDGMIDLVDVIREESKL